MGSANASAPAEPRSPPLPLRVAVRLRRERCFGQPLLWTGAEATAGPAEWPTEQDRATTTGVVLQGGVWSVSLCGSRVPPPSPPLFAWQLLAVVLRLLSVDTQSGMSYRTLQVSFVSGISAGCPGVSEARGKGGLATPPPKTCRVFLRRHRRRRTAVFFGGVSSLPIAQSSPLNKQTRRYDTQVRPHSAPG